MFFKPHQLFLISVALLLLFGSCTQKEEPSSNSDAELSKLNKEYLQLQKLQRDLESQMTGLKQENEVFKAGITYNSNRDREIGVQFKKTQKDLDAQYKEYQSLQKDYAELKASIEPISLKLNAAIAALRKELIGTKLGTIVLNDERQLHLAEVTEIYDDALRIKFDGGWTRIPYEELPPNIQQRFFYNPLLVSPDSLISESPTRKNSAIPPTPAVNVQALIEQAFAERNRQELIQFKLSMQKHIPELEQKIATAKVQIANLKQDRIDTAKKFNGSSRIKRSNVDRNKALDKFDVEIRRLERAIQSAEIQIKSWQKELLKNESNGK